MRGLVVFIGIAAALYLSAVVASGAGEPAWRRCLAWAGRWWWPAPSLPAISLPGALCALALDHRTCSAPAVPPLGTTCASTWRGLALTSSPGKVGETLALRRCCSSAAFPGRAAWVHSWSTAAPMSSAWRRSVRWPGWWPASARRFSKAIGAALILSAWRVAWGRATRLARATADAIRRPDVAPCTGGSRWYCSRPTSWAALWSVRSCLGLRSLCGRRVRPAGAGVRCCTCRRWVPISTLARCVTDLRHRDTVGRREHDSRRLGARPKRRSSIS
jgi:hypothetical protein